MIGLELVRIYPLWVGLDQFVLEEGAYVNKIGFY